MWPYIDKEVQLTVSSKKHPELEHKAVFLAALPICLVFILEVIAIMRGMDGVALSAAIGGITLLGGGGAGYFLGKRIKLNTSPKE